MIQRMADNSEKTALITGASSGIGEATALQLAELGYTVYAGARRVDRMSDLADRGIRTTSVDVTDDESMVALVETIIADTGRIDVLVRRLGGRARRGGPTSVGGERFRPGPAHSAGASPDASPTRRVHREHLLHGWQDLGAAG
jgi:NAD(P)-dependent dehydrogenase (short-subunit alcohol dehydrogenase family)